LKLQTRTPAKTDMNTPRRLNTNRFFSIVRTASASTLVAAAAAMAFVAVKPPSPSLVVKSDSKNQAVAKFRQDRDEMLGNKRALPGLERDGSPFLAAEEDYAKRAYPATDIPFSATLNARAAFENIQNRTAAATTSAASPSDPTWTLIGPSRAVDPSILTFTGTEYFTSGRITALAIAPTCTPGNCRVWVAAAGGGIWRTDNAFAQPPNWTFISGSFGTNAIGTLTYVAATNTLFAGTGEPNASGDSEAGLGIYKSTDGGNTWTHLASATSVPRLPTHCGPAPAYSGPAFDGRCISSIVVNGSTIYVGSTRGVRGVSSVAGGAVSLAPGLPPFGLWKSTDGGAHFTLLDAQGVCLNSTLAGGAGKVQSSFGSPRGVNHVELDPNNSPTVYAAAFQEGIWRSKNSGTDWIQIKTALDPNNNTDRAEFAVTKLANGKTRMYVGDGNDGTVPARFYRSDDAAAAGTPVFNDLTNSQNIDYCTGQCWYDNVVYSPPGKPDIVYLGGSFSYGTYGFTTNGRAFLRSANAGSSFTDMTWDATKASTPAGSCCQPNSIAPHGQHPDSHAIVEIPGTDSAIFGTDGGLMRSSGAFADISPQCTNYRGLSGTDLALCEQLLSQVPTFLYNLNTGLSTIQFQSLSVAADDATHLQGGNQDNGTFEHVDSSNFAWSQIIYGDGGQSGFFVSNSAVRFNSFFGQFHDANFHNGDPSKWVIISAPIASSPEGSYFYVPIIADPNPANGRTIYEGSQSVWRTQDWGGNQTFLEANCPEFTTPSTQPGCGDFVRIGPGGKTDLTASPWGPDRVGGFVAAIERAKSDTGTLWVATGTGRVFISKNANAPAGDVRYRRLDNMPSATAAPGRFVSSIYIDRANSNHAWISYSSYSALTPSTPGHVFEVTYNGTQDATWMDLDGGTGPMGDLPVTDLVRDDKTGDLYAATDFGVLKLASGNSANEWVVAGSGLPMVEVAGLTIVPSARVLYAATHGRSAWKLSLQ
jgi:hypothetical protein